MFSPLIKYFFLIICVFYTYHSILKITFSKKINITLHFLIAFLLTILSYSLKDYRLLIRLIILIMLSYLYLTVTTQTHPRTSLAAVLISSGISFIFYILSNTIISFIFVLIYKSESAIPYEKSYFPMCIVQFIGIYIMLKIKQIRNGIYLLIREKNITIEIITSLFFVVYIILISTYTNTLILVRLTILLVSCSSAFFLLFYWRHRITQTYREKLRQANEKSLLDEINEHKLTIEKLNADNKRLAAIIHADNKLVPAMLTAVTNHLENINNLTLEELTAHGQELSEQLRNMAKDRQGILESQHKETALLPKSGLPTVDGMLSFMEARSKEYNIAYKVVIDDNIKEMALDALNEEDLLRLLGDLIDNAIIAVKHSDKEKALLIHLGTLQNNFLVEISDSGIPFSIETYQRFGNEQYTTHKNSGGSGIGLIDIWKIKKKYKISLHIYEFPESHGIYTKKISFIFDRKNHFLLQTNRYKEITRELTRGDLYVFPYKSE